MIADSVIMAVVESLNMITRGSWPGRGGKYSVPSRVMVIFDMGNPLKMASCVGIRLSEVPVSATLALSLLWLGPRVTDEAAEVKLL
jgi:hypothetical protein